MDKKIIGIIAVMLIVCVIITTLVTVYPYNEDSTVSTSNANAAYVNRFFNKDKVIDINITLDKTDYEDILQDPQKEEYKQANIVIDGVEVDNVGFRAKGNSSLKSVASSDSDRFSFKVDFDQYLDGQTLSGLTKLNLNNNFNDASYMREYLSYYLLEQMGVPVPAYCFANIYVNGNLVGLYLAVEGIEEPFVQRYYGSDYGTLYKPYGENGAGTDLIYTDDNIKSYSGLQAVTGVKNGSNKALISMLKVLNEGGNLEQYLDVDEILRYFAVNTVLVNMDSYQGQFSHNYYLYEENGVFSFLPWDYNLSFGGFGGGGGSQSQTALSIDQPVSGTTLEKRPLLGKLLEIEEYKERYHQYIGELINGSFSLKNMSKMIEQTAELIRPYVENDPTKFYTIEQFELAISEGSSQQVSTINSASDQSNGTPRQIPGDGAAAKIQNGGQQIDVTQGKFPEQMGGNMMQGGISTGLISFIRDRIDNVTKQLNGEISAVTTTVADNVAGGTNDRAVDLRQNQRFPRGQVGDRPMQMPAGGQDQNRANMSLDAQGQAANGNIQQTGITGNMYIIGGSVLLLLVVLFIIFKKKTRYSI